MHRLRGQRSKDGLGLGLGLGWVKGVGLQCRYDCTFSGSVRVSVSGFPCWIPRHLMTSRSSMTAVDDYPVMLAREVVRCRGFQQRNLETEPPMNYLVGI